MAIDTDRQILGDWADEGYSTKEYEDHVVTVAYKGKEIAAFSQTAATREALQRACEYHQKRLREPVGVSS